MSQKIRLRRGLDVAAQSVILDPGEPGFTTDTNVLLIGTGTDNIKIASAELMRGNSTQLHYHDSDRDRSNHTGTQLASTISDLETVIENLNASYAYSKTQSDSRYRLKSTSLAITEVTNLQTQLDNRQLKSEKGIANGYASLDSNGLVPISQLPATVKESRVVADIAERDSITGDELFESLRCHVLDASADPTVDSGSAGYIYTGIEWQKTYEEETVNSIVDWSNIQNKPSSYPDSDLFNGLDSSKFMRTDQVNSINFSLSLTAQTTLILNPSYSTNQLRFNHTLDGQRFYIVPFYDGTPDYDKEFSFDYTRGSWVFDREPLVRSNEIWHEGNDGPGSGLDADLLDGIDSTQFLRSDIDTTVDGVITANKGIVSKQSIPSVPENSNSWYPGIYTSAVTSDPAFPAEYAAVATLCHDSISRGFQLTVSDNDLFFRRLHTSLTSTLWKKVWTEDNDGSGSGLDADLLDGLDSTKFSIMGGFQPSGRHERYSGDLNDISINSLYNFDGDNVTHAPSFIGPYWGFVWTQMHSANPNYRVQFCWAMNPQDGKAHLAYRRMDNEIWGSWAEFFNTDTVGPESGLDADTLDGTQLSDIFATRGSINTVDWDTIIDPGAYPVNKSPLDPLLHQPVDAYGWGVLLVVSSGVQNTIIQVYFPHHSCTDSSVYFRAAYNGVFFVDWKKIWSENNDGPGSGLDADTVDGIEGAKLLQKDIANSIDAGNNAIPLSLSRSSASVNQVSLALKTDNGSGTVYTGNIGIHDGVLKFGISGDLKTFGRTVWHSGNMGTGSGLDADKLDGLQASQFLRSDMDDSLLGCATFLNQVKGVGFTAVGSTTTPQVRTGGNWITGGSDCAGLNKLNNVAVQTWYGFSVSSSYLGGSVPQGTPAFSVDARNGRAYAYTGFRVQNNDVWHEGNDGPGSGLDADKLDGKHASEFYGSSTPPAIANVTGLQSALDAKQSTSSKGIANGYASLDGSGRVPSIQLPGNLKESVVVSNIAERNAISGDNLFAALRCHVLDASADSTVTSGSAGYIYTGSAWSKTYEGESMDVVLDWSNIQNKPSKYPDSDKLDGIDSSGFMRSNYANGYDGLSGPNSGNSNWIRTTSNGFIPFASGGASSIGTSAWPFNLLYVKTIYENGVLLQNKYLGISAKAVDSELLDGIDSSGYLRSYHKDTSNIVRKSTFEDGDKGDWNGSVVSVTGRDWTKALEVGTRDNYENFEFPVREGDILYFEADLDASTSNYSVNFGVRLRTSSNSYNWPTQGISSGTGWTRVSWSLTVPAGYIYARPFFQINGFSNYGTARATNLRITRVENGSEKLSSKVISSNVSLSISNRYLVPGGLTLTLPSSPSAGDTIQILPSNDWAANNLIIARNGKNIAGVSEDLTCDITQAFFLVYKDSANGWVIN